jgi:hypothetical protein
MNETCFWIGVVSYEHVQNDGIYWWRNEYFYFEEKKRSWCLGRRGTHA